MLKQTCLNLKYSPHEDAWRNGHLPVTFFVYRYSFTYNGSRACRNECINYNAPNDCESQWNYVLDSVRGYELVQCCNIVRCVRIRCVTWLFFTLSTLYSLITWSPVNAELERPWLFCSRPSRRIKPVYLSWPWGMVNGRSVRYGTTERLLTTAKLCAYYGYPRTPLHTKTSCSNR